jgi:hypothetical protein
MQQQAFQGNATPVGKGGKYLKRHGMLNSIES